MLKLFLFGLIITTILAEPPPQQYLPPSPQYGAPNSGVPAPQYGAPNSGGGSTSAGGGSKGADEESGPAKYQFSYEVKDAESGNDFGHQESRDGDVATGSYHVLLPDGRKQIVEYTADLEGYHPMIKYEGEANQGGGTNGYPKTGPQGPY